MHSKARTLFISVCALAGTAMVVIVPQASAESEVNRVCAPSGPNGTVCVALRTQDHSMRGRLGIDPSGTGATICSTALNIWRLDASGAQHLWLADSSHVCSSTGHIDVFTPYVGPACTGTYRYEVHASYTVTLPGGAPKTYSVFGSPVALAPGRICA
jgi:hypothetical protein